MTDGFFWSAPAGAADYLCWAYVAGVAAPPQTIPASLSPMLAMHEYLQLIGRDLAEVGVPVGATIAVLLHDPDTGIVHDCPFVLAMKPEFGIVPLGRRKHVQERRAA